MHVFTSTRLITEFLLNFSDSISLLIWDAVFIGLIFLKAIDDKTEGVTTVLWHKKI